MSDSRKYSLLLTDLYQLIMAYGYWKNQMHERESVFHFVFRKNPFQSGFSVACGLEDVIHYIQNFYVDEDELAYLANLQGKDGKPLFEKSFLEYLRHLRFTCNVDAIPEGTIVFPQEPLIRIRGPILQAQLLETALLNILSFQTLIATKAARLCHAAQGDPVIEFGLRRAQGINGGMAATRASYIGGCTATSNVLAGMRYGIPVKGTHAHSWVMAFDTEEQSFEAYAKVMPSNCVFLVDTYNTLEGVYTAVRVGKRLREQGYEFEGIRLDSGDLAYLSIEARKILDAEGFPDVAIMASNNLDEHIIASLKQQGAKINMWGVGTKLATAYDQPALEAAYKLSAIKTESGQWRFTIKLSEQSIKISNPGIHQVRRFRIGHEYVGDLVYNEAAPVKNDHVIVDPVSIMRSKIIPPEALAEDLLIPIFNQGQLVYSPPTIQEMRTRTHVQLDRFHPGIKRFLNPHEYPVGLETELHHLKTHMIQKIRGIHY